MKVKSHLLHMVIKPGLYNTVASKLIGEGQLSFVVIIK